MVTINEITGFIWWQPDSVRRVGSNFGLVFSIAGCHGDFICKAYYVVVGDDIAIFRIDYAGSRTVLATVIISIEKIRAKEIIENPDNKRFLFFCCWLWLVPRSPQRRCEPQRRLLPCSVYKIRASYGYTVGAETSRACIFSSVLAGSFLVHWTTARLIRPPVMPANR